MTNSILKLFVVEKIGRLQYATAFKADNKNTVIRYRSDINRIQ